MESGRYLDSFNIISTSDFGGRHLEFLSTVPYPCTVSGMVANVGVALESIRYLSVQHFHFRLGVRHFEFRYTDNVEQCMQWHIDVGHGRKCGDSRYRLAKPSPAVQKWFPPVVFLAAILSFNSRPTSTNVSQCHQCQVEVSRDKKNDVGTSVFGFATQSYRSTVISSWNFTNRNSNIATRNSVISQPPAIITWREI